MNEKAAMAVERLFGWCRMPDVGDPEVYLAGAVAIIGEYPDEIGEQISNPQTGTRLLCDFPTLSAIRKACDELFEPIAREWERQRAHASHVAGALPRPRRTPEQQARVDAQVADVRRALGVPVGARHKLYFPNIAGEDDACRGPPESRMTAEDLATDL